VETEEKHQTQLDGMLFIVLQ